jgi:hypothetical protein
MPHALLAFLLSTPAHAADSAPAPAEGGEDAVSADQSVDGYTELEDAQAGQQGKLEERLWLTWGYVPAEGYTPSDTLELSYTGKGVLGHTEFDFAQYFEHDDVDNSSGFLFGWMQRWVKDGGRKSAIPSIGTLTEYYLRTPGLIRLPGFAPGATVGDHVAEILTVAKYLGPGTLYLNGEVQRQIFNSQICVTEADVAIQPADAPDQSPELPNVDGCDYWAPWTLAARIGYKLPIVTDRLDLEVDFTHETNEFTTQTTVEDAEVHHPYEMGNVALIWRINDHWTLSPGVLFGLDGREETPAYEAGIFLLHE